MGPATKEVNPDPRKFKAKYVSLMRNPIIVVGQNPGKQRPGEQSGFAWEGNKSADLLTWVLNGQHNLILTNVCNYRIITPDHLSEGVYDLMQLVEKHRPPKIICLGGYAHNQVKKMYFEKTKVVKLPHPSWIVRFNKDREKYKKLFTSHLFHV